MPAGTGARWLECGARKHGKYAVRTTHGRCAVQPTRPPNTEHTMKIEKDTAVTLMLKVSNAQGGVIEDGKTPMVYLHGGYNNTLPKIEEALQDLEAGAQLTLCLATADAFGAREDALVRAIPKTQFPPGIKVGGQLEGQGEDGSPQLYTVVKIKGPEVHLDGNHPLAGLDLVFQIKVMSVRAASAVEIAHQHVHGEHGHNH